MISADGGDRHAPVSAFSLLVAEKALNHASGSLAGIVKVYQRHEYAEETKAAFIAWGNFIAALVSDKTAKIIPIQSGRKRQKSR